MSLAALVELARSGAFSNNTCDALFGEQSLLITAAEEVLRSTSRSKRAAFLTAAKNLLAASDPAAVAESLDSLLDGTAATDVTARTDLRLIYGTSEVDAQVWQQGLHVVRGLVLGLCASMDPAGLNVKQAVEAVRHFNKAWLIADKWRPVLPRTIPGASQATGWQEYCKALEGRQSTGFWVVWDLCSRLNRPKVPPSLGLAHPSSPATQSASLPIPLYAERPKVARFNVELIQNDGRGLRPDPFFMGLMTLGPNKNSFHQAIQTAWHASGLASEAVRGRWFVGTHRNPAVSNHETLRLGTLAGRSAEAAACIALWVAWQDVPGHPKFRRPFELDPRGTVTAHIQSGRGPNALLGKVDGLPEKLTAAAEAGLSLVIVSSKQPTAHYVRHPAVKARQLTVLPAKTVGEAFRQLLAGGDLVRRFRRWVVNEHWLSRWEEGTGDVRPID
jgi:hypothetical protein